MTKVCTRCSAEKTLDEFHRDPKGKFGRRAICKVCALSEWSTWLLDHREEWNAHQRERYQNSAEYREKRREYNAAYRLRKKAEQ